MQDLTSSFVSVQGMPGMHSDSRNDLEAASSLMRQDLDVLNLGTTSVTEHSSR